LEYRSGREDHQGELEDTYSIAAVLQRTVNAVGGVVSVRCDPRANESQRSPTFTVVGAVLTTALAVVTVRLSRRRTAHGPFSVRCAQYRTLRRARKRDLTALVPIPNASCRSCAKSMVSEGGPKFEFARSARRAIGHERLLPQVERQKFDQRGTGNRQTVGELLDYLT